MLRRSSIIWLVTVAVLKAPTSNALALVEQRSTCPASFVRCGDSNLPSDFCCPSTSTCISLDNASSAICCPQGENCTFIESITCDLQLQNPAIHPTNSVKTTKLNGQLPVCGDACCPFGYTCRSNSTCALDTAAAVTATSIISSATMSTSTSTSTTSTSTSASPSASASTSSFSSATPLSMTAEAFTSASQVTPAMSGSSDALSSASSSTPDPLAITNGAVTTKCPEFPLRALLAGFFPGALIGAVAALLFSLCCSRRKRREQINRNKMHPSSAATYPSTSSHIVISSPIPSDESSYRTDFLLRPNPLQEQQSGSDCAGTRSMLHRTSTRVRSFFAASLAKSSTSSDTPPMPAPRLSPATPQQQQQQRWRRQPSTESIKVYSPPGALHLLKPEPYPLMAATPNAMFTELMAKAGFQNSDTGDPSFRVNGLPGFHPGHPRGKLR